MHVNSLEQKILSQEDLSLNAPWVHLPAQAVCTSWLHLVFSETLGGLYKTKIYSLLFLFAPMPFVI